MTVEQALSIIDNIVSKAPMTRMDHHTALEALRILKEASQKKPTTQP